MANPFRMRQIGHKLLLLSIRLVRPSHQVNKSYAVRFHFSSPARFDIRYLKLVRRNGVHKRRRAIGHKAASSENSSSGSISLLTSSVIGNGLQNEDQSPASAAYIICKRGAQYILLYFNHSYLTFNKTFEN